MIARNLSCRRRVNKLETYPRTNPYFRWQFSTAFRSTTARSRLAVTPFKVKSEQSVLPSNGGGYSSHWAAVTWRCAW